MNLNKVFIAGRLTADPILRTTPAGHQVASFSVATNRNWTNQAGQKQESAEFHNVVVWDKQADLVTRFMTKGSLILVEGRLQTRAWDDKQGQKRRTTEIVAERIQFGPRTFSGGSSGGNTNVVSGSPIVGNNEVPTINLEEASAVDGSTSSPQEEIKAEDLPF